MTTSRTTQPTFTRTWLLWTAGFLAFPIAGVAIALKLVGGVVDDARVAVTGLGSRATLVTAAADALKGRPLTKETIVAAAAATQRASRPMDNTSGTIAARRIAAKVMTERALRSLR